MIEINKKKVRHNPYIQEILNHQKHIICYQDTIPENWEDYFHSNNPMTIDIGSGSGNFINYYAQIHQNNNCIGIETKYKRLVKSSKKVERNQLKNVCFLQRRAEEIDTLFQPKSIQNIFIQFPDPWPKKKHHKNRLMNHDYLIKLHHILCDNGIINFKTDYKAYFNIVHNIVQNFELFSILDVKLENNSASNQVQENDFMTEFETIFVQKGLPIYSMQFTKKRTDE